MAVFEYHDRLRALGVPLNGRTYGSMLKACARAGNVAWADRVFELMNEAGIEPNEFHWSQLMTLNK